jgi:tetratricopeptide (TPR) repeat protein
MTRRTSTSRSRKRDAQPRASAATGSSADPSTTGPAAAARTAAATDARPNVAIAGTSPDADTSRRDLAARSPRLRSLLLPAAFVVAMAVAAFWNGMGNTIVHDDVFFVPARHELTWKSVGQIFREDTWSASGSGAGTYRPLAILSFAVNGWMFGNDASGYHATNVVLHALASLFVFLLVAELMSATGTRVAGAGSRAGAARSGIDGPPGTSVDPAWIAALAAALFAVHPVHTEAVDSVFNRSEVMATLGVASALWAIVRWHATRPVLAWTTASVVYLAALLCRESAASLPVLAAAALWIAHPGEPAGTRLRRLAPIAVLVLPLAEYFVLRGHSLASQGERAGPLLGVTTGEDFVSRVVYSLATLREYVRMLLWPHPLRATYENFTGEGLVASLAVHGVLVAGAIASLRRAPLVTLAVAFFYVSLAPSTRVFTWIGAVVGEMRLQNTLLIAERVAYLPSISVALAASAAIAWLVRVRGIALAAAVVAPVVVTGIWLTTARNAEWKSAVELFGAEVRAAPENWDAWRLYVSALSNAERHEEAAAACDTQLDTPSPSAQLFNNCGVVYDKLGRDEHAMKSYRRAIDLGLASVGHANLGRVYARLGRQEEARAEFVAAIETEMNPAQKHYRTAVMLLRFHPERSAEARREVQAALALQPDFAAARQLLSQIRR